MSTAKRVMQGQQASSEFDVLAKFDKGGYSVNKQTHAKTIDEAKKILKDWQMFEPATSIKVTDRTTGQTVEL